MKQRIDKLLVDRGLAPSRERAQAMILAGNVLVDEQKIDKPGTNVPEDATIRLLGSQLRYVSRGGLKLEHALKHWSIDVSGRTCADIGTSTGGFTDCLIQHGAACVVAIDTGYGQIDHKLRSDPRVRLMEDTNARYLTRSDLDSVLGRDPAVSESVSLVVMDVSFISASLVLPAVISSAFGEQPGSRAGRSPEAVVLVKPQFEVGREKVGKGGIVRDAAEQAQAVEKIRLAIEELGAQHIETTDSPITGAEGNREFLLYARWLN